MSQRYAENSRFLRLLGKQQYLLASLVALLVFLPLLRATNLAPVWLSGLLTLIMITGPLSIAARPVDFYASLTLGLMVTVLAWADVLFNVPLLLITGRCVTVAFFLLLSVLIFRRYLFGNSEVTQETLIAAVNAYVCLGIMYAFAYHGLMLVDPNSFHGTFMDTPDFPGCIYLSFVTMTTLGYGDITPQTEMAAVLSWSQALLGQLFIALTIARIVGVMVAKDTSG